MKISNEMIRRRIMAAVELSIMKNQLVISFEKDECHPLLKMEKVRQHIFLFKILCDAILSSLSDHEANKKGKAFRINMEGSNAPL